MFSNDDDDTNNSIPIKRKAKTVPKYFPESWLEDSNLKLFIEKCKDPTKTRCKICDKEMASGKSELEKHAEGKNKENMKCIKMQKPITSYTSGINVSHEMNVKTAEIKLAAFFAEHNLAIQVIEHLMPLLKNIFDDSKVAQDKMKRTKCTEIIKNVLAKTEIDNIVKELKFSILIDESTDLSNEKHLCVLVKYCETESGKVVTTLLKLVKLNATDCSAEKMYSAFKSTLNKYQVPLANIIGLASDNCNTMTGIHDSFHTYLKKDVPNAILVPCICHSAAIIASRACEELPRSPEELLRATYSYISGSSKRCSVLNEIQDFFYLEKKKILNFSTTR